MKFDPQQHDLASPDGFIVEITSIDERTSMALVRIEGINRNFIGYTLPESLVLFNIKSTLAQLGVEAIKKGCQFLPAEGIALVQVELKGLGKVGRAMLKCLYQGAFIGKLFAADDRRLVRDPEYLLRMFGRADRYGRPLLSLGGMHGSNTLILDKIDGRTVAYLTLKNGRVVYDNEIEGFLPTIGKALQQKVKTRELLPLHQVWEEGGVRNVEEGELLLVKTQPLHIRTVFARVVDPLLEQGYHHTAASVLQPDTRASGDIYEFYGSSKREITDLPLEFYTLEPYREHVFFTDRDQLKAALENPVALFKAFESAPQPTDLHAATFVVKSEQLLSLKNGDWNSCEPHFHDLPGLNHGARQAALIERYIETQPSYPYLKGIEEGYITSEGILLSRYFPTPLLKRMFLSEHVAHCVKAIYFMHPSSHHKDFFSQEDRALLNDLNKFAIATYWVDSVSGKILQYTQKKDRESGLFVPLNKIETYLNATLFGVYGSNLIAGNFENELKVLLQAVVEMRPQMNHPLLNPKTPLALITGGGPGAMELGNRIAKELEILSCANIADFHQKDGVVNEQKQNPYIEAKMTYRLQQLVERQSEFNLDFPIFVMGGIGTDFEYTLEEVRRKVGAQAPTPVLLFGSVDYWKEKITARYNANLQAGTIRGSEWLTNCFFVVQTGAQAASVMRRFFEGTLPIGKTHPAAPLGFVIVE